MRLLHPYGNLANSQESQKAHAFSPCIGSGVVVICSGNAIMEKVTVSPYTIAESVPERNKWTKAIIERAQLDGEVILADTSPMPPPGAPR